MAIKNLDAFLHTYFTSHHCKVNNSEDGVLHVKLTEEMDRALMNRPFYWHYIKKMGQNGDPMHLTLITNPNKRDGKGDWVHFGSPRLQQIINHLKENEKFTMLFQQIKTDKNTALYPWLVMNIKISYKGKQKKDEIISIGLHLINGMMKLEMMDILQKIPLQMTISDYCYTISPLIKIKSGFIRIESVIENYINNQPHEWADASFKTLKEEIDLLKHFYQGITEIEDLEQQMDNEIENMKKRYTPSISMEVINGGIFYLSENINHLE
ncbi:YqhG family protein [Virgibacillus byunsanensis]|uniref:YqhG family protein n=1 Tax=Virgibacillus byunsanensis TaxID=570945 RepID=A0ABW3LJA7_9BACI